MASQPPQKPRKSDPNWGPDCLSSDDEDDERVDGGATANAPVGTGVNRTCLSASPHEGNIHTAAGPSSIPLDETEAKPGQESCRRSDSLDNQQPDQSNNAPPAASESGASPAAERSLEEDFRELNSHLDGANGVLARMNARPTQPNDGPGPTPDTIANIHKSGQDLEKGVRNLEERFPAFSDKIRVFKEKAKKLLASVKEFCKKHKGSAIFGAVAIALGLVAGIALALGAPVLVPIVAGAVAGGAAVVAIGAYLYDKHKESP